MIVVLGCAGLLATVGNGYVVIAVGILAVMNTTHAVEQDFSKQDVYFHLVLTAADLFHVR